MINRYIAFKSNILPVSKEDPYGPELASSMNDAFLAGSRQNETPNLDA